LLHYSKSILHTDKLTSLFW